MRIFLKKIKSFFQTNWLEVLVNFYKSIPSIYKTTFWTVFIALNIVFAYHTVNFIWGNHERSYVREGISWNNFWYEARFTETIPYALFGFELLPILLSLFAFAGISMTVLALAIYWKIPKEKWLYIIFGLTMAFIPYNLSWLYHIAQTSFLWGGSIIVFSLILLDKITEGKVSRWWHFAVVFLLWFALGFNAAFINTIFICFIGCCLIDLCHGQKLSMLFKKGVIGLIDIFTAALMLKCSVILAIKHDVIIHNFYNTTTIKLSDVLSKLKEIAGYSLEQFTITYPFFEKTCLCMMWIVSILALLTVLGKLPRKKWWLNVFVAIFAFVGLLFASQFAIFISDNRLHLQFLFRLTGFFSLYFIFALMLAILCNFWRVTFFKNVLFILTVFIIGLFIQRDVYAIRIWKHGWEAENKIHDRIMARIENTPDFSYDKRYQIAVIGDLPLRAHFYRGEYKNEDVSVLGWSYRAPWLQQAYMNFYAPVDFIERQYHSGWTMEYTERLFKALSEDALTYIYENAAPWPAPGAVIVQGKFILVFMNKAQTRIFKRLLRDHIRGRNSWKTFKSISASHPEWGDIATIRFLERDRILRVGTNDTATVLEFDNQRLVLKWDDFGVETFIKNSSDIFELASINSAISGSSIILASHEEWHPAGEPQKLQFISKNKIVRVASQDIAIVKKITDNELILDWYAHGTEYFKKDGNGVYRFYKKE